MEKRKDDLVKLVNISDKGFKIVDGKNVPNPKEVVFYTYASNSQKVEDFLVVDREEAEHALGYTRKATENRMVLDIEELPEGQRTKNELSRSGEEANRYKGIVSEQEAKILALEEERRDLLSEIARLKSQLAKAKGK